MNNQLLPPNATPTEIALAGAVARISDVAVPLRTLYQPLACPPQALPPLAWAFSLDEWDANWTEAQKRAAIAGSVYVHRHKGTIGAVKRALSALGLQVQVQEWFNQVPTGTPYTFRLLLTADQTGFSQAQLSKLTDVVNSTKNLRSHLDVIVPAVSTTAGPTVAALAGMGSEVTSTGYQYSLVADGSVIANGGRKANGFKLN
jgi:phage tail P2-like protein